MIVYWFTYATLLAVAMARKTPELYVLALVVVYIEWRIAQPLCAYLKTYRKMMALRSEYYKARFDQLRIDALTKGTSR